MAESKADVLPIDFTGMGSFVPYEGIGNPDRFPFEGIAECTITSIRMGKSKAGNGTVKLVMHGAEDVTKGLQLIHDCPYTGVDSAGKPMIYKLGELLLSAGVKMEVLKKMEGKKLEVDKTDAFLAKFLSPGTKVYPRIKDDVYEGREQSKVDGYAPPEKFAEGQAAGTNRKHASAKAAKPAAAAAKTESAPAAAAAKPAAADPIDDLMG